MSHYMTALAMRQTGLKPATKIVLYWLADHHNGETGHCFPSISRLAKCCEMDKATVKRHLAILEDARLIERRHRQRENGSFTSTEYILNLGENCAKGVGENCAKGGGNLRLGVGENCAPHNLGSNNLGIEPTPLPPKGEDRFEEFWQAVPRKIGKGQARRAWKTAIKKADPDTIISAMRQYAEQRRGQDGQFTAHPSTWLNGERWLDEGAEKPTDFYDRILNQLRSNDTDGLFSANESDGGGRDGISQAIPSPGSFGRSGPDG